MAVAQTLVIIKPDGLMKLLTGNILTRLSDAKLIIVCTKVVSVSRELAEKHYERLINKPFLEALIEFIKGALHKTYRIVSVVYEGDDAINRVRDIVGDTNPENANPVAIRGAYGRITTSGIFENVVHASSSPQDAEKEIKLWFEPLELVNSIYPVKEITLEKVTKKVWHNDILLPNS